MALHKRRTRSRQTSSPSGFCSDLYSSCQMPLNRLTLLHSRGIWLSPPRATSDGTVRVWFRMQWSGLADEKIESVTRDPKIV